LGASAEITTLTLRVAKRASYRYPGSCAISRLGLLLDVYYLIRMYVYGYMYMYACIRRHGGPGEAVTASVNSVILYIANVI
jgi:hypothetical protein